MIIRPAMPKDITEVKSIVDALQVSRDSPNWQEKTSGLFEYPKSKKELMESINPYFLVAQVDEKIRGYSLAYDNTFLHKYHGSSNSLEWRFLLDRVEGNFLYIDQLGVLSQGTLGSGRIANNLAENAFSQARKAKLEMVLAYVCEKPLNNKVSQRFMERKGLKRFTEVKIEDGVVLGAFKRRL